MKITQQKGSARTPVLNNCGRWRDGKCPHLSIHIALLLLHHEIRTPRTHLLSLGIGVYEVSIATTLDCPDAHATLAGKFLDASLTDFQVGPNGLFHLESNLATA